MAYYVSLNVSATGDTNELKDLCRRINSAKTIDDILEKNEYIPVSIPTEFLCKYTPVEDMKELSFIMNSEGFSLRQTLFESLKKDYPSLGFIWKEFDELDFYSDPVGYTMEEGTITPTQNKVG